MAMPVDLRGLPVLGPEDSVDGGRVAAQAMRLAVLLVLAAALAGCAGKAGVDADATMPGVVTDSRVDDDFRCGELLFAAGCTVVRIPHVVSGCIPEVPGYLHCNATIGWEASSGAVAPGSRLVMRVNDTAAGSCIVDPGAVCGLAGQAAFGHSFAGPGEARTWTLVLAARLESPDGTPATTGEFTLTVRMEVRAQDIEAADA